MTNGADAVALMDEAHGPPSAAPARKVFVFVGIVGGVLDELGVFQTAKEALAAYDEYAKAADVTVVCGTCGDDEDECGDREHDFEPEYDWSSSEHSGSVSECEIR